MRRFVILLVLASFAVAAGQQPAPPVGISSWSFDEITLTNKNKIQGIILSEAPNGLRFQWVSHLPGRPTVTLTTIITKAEIASVKPLSDADRAVLKDRLAELDPSGKGERERMASLELVATDWPGKMGGGKRYRSDYFDLMSSGSEELTRRSAVRLEQIYTAFARYLHPTTEGHPTTIMLATDEEEYKTLLGPLGESFLLNPAVFDPANNRILCGSKLKPLGTELQNALVHHGQQLASLDKYAAEVRKLYPKGAELDRHLKAVGSERDRVWAADKANGAKFDQATKQVFAVLYHESFHAYVGTFVYPPLKPDDVKAGKGTGELPRWLNEGLAQVFETAVVEAGELRADFPDKDRLNRAKDWVKRKNGGSLVPLSDLLVIGKDAFLTSHADQKAAADRAYLTSWALAYYLTFDRRVIGTEAFKKYLVAVNSGGDPRQAFAKLVGQELPAFEKDWHSYLLRLHPDGTVDKKGQEWGVGGGGSGLGTVRGSVG